MSSNYNPINAIWRVFASVKLAVTLFILIASSSIIGTIIEQNVSPEKNAMLFTKIFGVLGDKAIIQIYEVAYKLGFMDMYHSWWFRVFLFLFSANIVICSIDRLPRIWKLVQAPMHPKKEKVIEADGDKQEGAVKANLNQAKETVIALLRKKGYSPLESSEHAGSVQLYSHKHAFTRLGVYVVHLSIILIFAGAMLGSLWGFHGQLALPENAVSDTYYNNGAELPLGFSVKCYDFDIDYYDNDMPKTYRSDLAIIDNGQQMVRQTISVNNPLKYKGVTFYQSSYGKLQDAKGKFIIKVVNDKGQQTRHELNLGDEFPIEGVGLRGKVVDFSPALWKDESGKAFTYSEEMVNPAVYILFIENTPAFKLTEDAYGDLKTDGLPEETINQLKPLQDKPFTDKQAFFEAVEQAIGKEKTEQYRAAILKGAENEVLKYAGWIWKRYPITGELADEKRKVIFEDYAGVMYTGLQVRKDPGVWLVYLGCFVMTIGLFMAFFMSHKKIWILLKQKKNAVSIAVTGATNKNKLSFVKELEMLRDRFIHTYDGKGD
jgi:cytochrome c biogenesis protein